MAYWKALVEIDLFERVSFAYFAYSLLLPARVYRYVLDTLFNNALRFWVQWAGAYLDIAVSQCPRAL